MLTILLKSIWCNAGQDGSGVGIWCLVFGVCFITKEEEIAIRELLKNRHIVENVSIVYPIC